MSLAISTLAAAATLWSLSGDVSNAQTAPPPFTMVYQKDNKTITVSVPMGSTSGDTISVCLWKEEPKGSLDCRTNKAALYKSGLTQTNSGGVYNVTLPAGSFSGVHYLSVLEAEPTGNVTASAGASVLPNGKSTASAGAPAPTKDFKVDVTMPYCDRSLPYSYKQGDAKTWKAVEKLQFFMQADLAGVAPAGETWNKWFGQQYQQKSISPNSPVVTFTTGIPTPFNDNGPNDPIDQDGAMNDEGDPLLADPTHDFSLNTTDVQRLIVRSLFGPNPFPFACSYSYLTNSVPASDTNATLDATGKPETFMGNGLAQGKPFNFNDPDNPSYYLINIVRWADAPSAQTGTAAIAPPQLYQAASDDWYLMNYSNKKDYHHDAINIFGIRKFKPEMLESTLNVVGDNRVVFIGIHLAPQPSAQVIQPSTASGIAISPTEMDWYKTQISYNFHAAHVEPVNVQDLNSLLGILESDLGLTPSKTTSATPVANAEMKLMVAPETIDIATQLKSSLDGLDTASKNVPAAAKKSLDTVLRYSAECLSLTDIAPLEKAITALLNDAQCKSALNGDASKDKACVVDAGSVLTLAEKAALTCDANFKAQPTPTDSETAFANLKAAVDAINTDFANAIVSSDAGIADPGRPILYSLEQGQYGAAIVTNLTKLPVNLVGTWTATFAGVPGAPAGVAAPKATGNLPDAPAPTNQTNVANSGVAAKTTGQKSTTQTSAQTTAAAATSGAVKTPICTAALDTSVTTMSVQTKCSNAGTQVHDERLSWWDISLLVPVTGYSDLTYQVSTPPSTGGTTGPNVVTAKSVTRTNVYAMADLMPFEQDLVNPPTIGIPYLAAGLPLAGKVFDKPYFAVGETFTLPKSIANASWLSKLSSYLPLSVNPVFGWVYNKEFHTTTNPTTNAVSQVPYRTLKPQFAIGFSFRSISSSVLSGLSKSSSGSSSKTASDTKTTASPTQ
jgi:hypothetical protein